MATQKGFVLPSNPWWWAEAWEEVETRFTCPVCSTGTVSRSDNGSCTKYFCPLCGHIHWWAGDLNITLARLDALRAARRES